MPGPGAIRPRWTARSKRATATLACVTTLGFVAALASTAANAQATRGEIAAEWPCRNTPSVVRRAHATATTRAVTRGLGDRYVITLGDTAQLPTWGDVLSAAARGRLGCHGTRVEARQRCLEPRWLHSMYHPRIFRKRTDVITSSW